MVTTAFSFSLRIVNAIATSDISVCRVLTEDSRLVDKNYGIACILCFENKGLVAAFYYLSIKKLLLIAMKTL